MSETAFVSPRAQEEGRKCYTSILFELVEQLEDAGRIPRIDAQAIMNQVFEQPDALMPQLRIAQEELGLDNTQINVMYKTRLLGR